MPTTSEELIEAAKNRENRDAWERFAQTYLKMIYIWVRKTGLGQEDAYDVVQIIFFKLIGALPKYSKQPGVKFRAWLKTISRNTAIDWLRKKDHQLKLLDDMDSDFEKSDFVTELDNSGASLSADNYLSVVKAQIQERVLPKNWEAFERFALEGEDAKSVGADLEMSDDAVRQAARRIRVMFQKQLQHRDGGIS